MSEAPISFDQIIAPLSRARFLSETWTRNFLHQPGAKARFTALLPWEALNAILRWHSPPQPQLRLFQEGAMLDTRRYIDGPVGNHKLNAGNLIALLAQGASMTLDAVNEVSPTVAELTANMEQALDCPVSVNLYAGWRSQRALDLRWESHELFILQLSGRKRWQVFAPTRVHPLGDDVEQAPSPTGQPLWDGVLNDGDLLYLPRGLWHAALPLDEPSLHLSFAATPSAGADFIQWWMLKLRRHPELRAAVTGSGAASRKTYMNQLMQNIEASAAADLLDEFQRERRAARRARPRLRLPHAPIEQAALPDTLSIRLATRNTLHIEHPAGEPMARFFAAGNHWFIRPEFIPAFQRLSAHQSVPYQELAAMIADQQLRAMLVSTLDALATAGVLFKEGDANR